MVLYSNEEINIGEVPITNTPMLWINSYLQEKFAEHVKIAVPMFPTRPSNIDDISSMWVTIDGQRYPYSGVMGVYDRMFKRRNKTFPHIKSEQMLFYFYATESNVAENMIAISEVLYRLMDNEDETAQDINSWASSKQIDVNGTNLENKFFFHRFRVYQLEEVQDVINFGTVRTYAGSKVIIDFDYHRVD